MPIHNGTEWKTEKAWWVKVSGTWQKSTNIWKKVSGVWEKMSLLVDGLVSTFAGSGTSGSSNGVGIFADFSNPTGIVYLSPYFYICDFSNNKIRRIDDSTATVSDFVGSGTAGDLSGIGSSANLDGPYYICVFGSNLYFSDFSNGKIKKIDVSTLNVTDFSTGISQPSGICHHSGFFYVCDLSGNTVLKIDDSTGISSVFAGSGTAGYSDGVGVLAEFDAPNGITEDSGFLYVTNSAKIRKINISTSEVTTVAGSGTLGDADGIGAAAEFNDATGIKYNSGYLLVSDLSNNKIRKIDVSTTEVTTFAGSGTAGDNNGVGVLAEFDSPESIELYDGNYYICDSGNNKIRKIIDEV